MASMVVVEAPRVNRERAFPLGGLGPSGALPWQVKAKVLASVSRFVLISDQIAASKLLDHINISRCLARQQFHGRSRWMPTTVVARLKLWVPVGIGDSTSPKPSRRSSTTIRKAVLKTSCPGAPENHQAPSVCPCTLHLLNAAGPYVWVKTAGWVTVDLGRSASFSYLPYGQATICPYRAQALYGNLQRMSASVVAGLNTDPSFTVAFGDSGRFGEHHPKEQVRT